MDEESVDIWGPIPEVWNTVEQECRLKTYGKSRANVLDIGPGPNPFPLATHLVDFKLWPEWPEGMFYADVDLNTQLLPLHDSDIGYVHCRGVIEDLRNPYNVLTEIQRWGVRNGYIETPSPAHELMKRVDAGRPYRGYYHHYWFVWTEDATLHLLPKSGSFVEHLNVEIDLSNTLMFNNYYFFGDGLRFAIHEFGRDIEAIDHRVYVEWIKRAVDKSAEHTAKLAARHGWKGVNVIVPQGAEEKKTNEDDVHCP